MGIKNLEVRFLAVTVRFGAITCVELKLKGELVTDNVVTLFIDKALSKILDAA